MDAARLQVYEDVLNNLQHQLEEVTLASVRRDNCQSVTKEPKISMPNKFEGFFWGIYLVYICTYILLAILMNLQSGTCWNSLK